MLCDHIFCSKNSPSNSFLPRTLSAPPSSALPVPIKQAPAVGILLPHQTVAQHPVQAFNPPPIGQFQRPTPTPGTIQEQRMASAKRNLVHNRGIARGLSHERGASRAAQHASATSCPTPSQPSGSRTPYPFGLAPGVEAAHIPAESDTQEFLIAVLPFCVRLILF